jgi:hypothetical protein
MMYVKPEAHALEPPSKPVDPLDPGHSLPLADSSESQQTYVPNSSERLLKLSSILSVIINFTVNTQALLLAPHWTLKTT